MFLYIRSFLYNATNTKEFVYDKTSLPLLKRNITQRNIDKFINEVNNISLQNVMDSYDAQVAYSAFQIKL